MTSDEVSGNKVPLFYGNEKDTLTPRSWISRVEQIATTLKWDDDAKRSAAATAFREVCEAWYQVHIAKKKKGVVTWAYFKEKFLEFTGASDASYKGFLQWHAMMVPRNGTALNLYYTKLTTAHSEWSDGIEEPEEPTSWKDYFDEDITNVKEFGDIPPALLRKMQLAIEENAKLRIEEHVAMGMFYHGQSDIVKDFLMEKTCKSVSEMRSLVAKFELNKAANRSNGKINAIQEVDAVKFKQRQQSTQPAGQTQNNKYKNMTCYYCKKKGHGQNTCNKRARDGAPTVPPPPKKVHAVADQSNSQSNGENLNF